ncbi:MAG: GIY-YIG nuclease family protein [Candidatus Helarchaeota archaeon]
MRGVYVIIIKKIKDSEISIGKFGTFFFPKGIYLYVGSALGNASSTSIENRLKRHYKKKKKLHWHIDYLLADDYTEIISSFYGCCDDKMECSLLQMLKNQSESFYLPIKNFGASDCVKKCGGHLIYTKDLEYDIILTYITNSFRNLNLKAQEFMPY